jgi:hypothetical protein
MRLAALSFVVVLAGCAGPSVTNLGDSGATPPPDQGGSSPTPTPTPPGGPQLANGNYSYVIGQVPSNTCWDASKGIPAVPSTTTMAVTVAGSMLTMNTTLQGATQTFTLTLDGAALTGNGTGTLDLTPDGVDCQLSVTSTLTGAVTADNAFTTSQVIDIAAQSGTQCSLAVGTIENQQLSALPCSLTMNGSATES